VAAVGFRCFDDAISVVVLSGETGAPQVDESYHCKLQGGDRGEQLVYLRKEVHEVLQRAHPTLVMYKSVEGNAQASRRRLEAEGVLQEAVASKGIAVRSQTKGQLKSAIGWTGMAKDVLDALSTRGLNATPVNQKEAALAALAALGHA
jgi:Holliday junction resolvasome RuvABC endonuclease subunit